MPHAPRLAAFLKGGIVELAVVLKACCERVRLFAGWAHEELVGSSQPAPGSGSRCGPVRGYLRCPRATPVFYYISYTISIAPMSDAELLELADAVEGILDLFGPRTPTLTVAEAAAIIGWLPTEPYLPPEPFLPDEPYLKPVTPA